MRNLTRNLHTVPYRLMPIQYMFKLKGWESDPVQIGPGYNRAGLAKIRNLPPSLLRN